MIDAVNIRDDKRLKVVVKSLLKDLGVEYNDSDIHSAYSLGPIRTGIARPRSVKVTFDVCSTKGEIFKNIDKLNSQIPGMPQTI